MMNVDQEALRRYAQSVLGMLQREHPHDNSAGHLSMENWEWPTGVALYGIWKTYQLTGDEQNKAYLIDWYDRWLFKVPAPHRNVNTVCPMLALVCLYQETGNAAYLEPIRSWARWIVGEMPRTEFGGLQHITIWNKHYQQLWSDTLFMTCLFLLKAGQVLAEPTWAEEAKYQFLLHAPDNPIYLLVAECCLFSFFLS